MLLLLFVTACSSPEVDVLDGAEMIDDATDALEPMSPWPPAEYEWGNPSRGCEEVVSVTVGEATHDYGMRLLDERGRAVLEAWDEDLDGTVDRTLRRRWRGENAIEVVDTTPDRTWVYAYDYDELGNLTYSSLDQGPTGRPNAEWFQEWDGDRLLWRGFDYPVGGDLEEERYQVWTDDEVHIAYHNHLWESDNYTEVRMLDANGRWRTGALDTGANGEIDWEIDWDWTADGMPLSEVWSSSWDAVTQESSWSWGPHGLVREEVTTRRSSTVVSHRSESLEYDEHGRVVARTVTDTDPAVPDHRFRSDWDCAGDGS